MHSAAQFAFFAVSALAGALGVARVDRRALLPALGTAALFVGALAYVAAISHT